MSDPKPGSDKDNAKALVGIDLGTTFSVIARWDGKQAESMQTHAGPYETQSVVYCKEGKVSVGEGAYNKGLMDPDNVILGVKRQMGDASKKITLGGREFTPIELSAEILKFMYADQKQRIPPFQPRGMVVTVPYYFKEPERRNTRAAAELAGFKCLGILEEPIAGSLAYAVQRALKDPSATRNETILVFDLGGGTFDLTLFRLEQKGIKLRFEVLASGGDNFLGGLDFDEAFTSYILEKCNIELRGIPEKQQRRARMKLLPAAKLAKERLSFTLDWNISIGDAVPGEIIDLELTRDDFEKIIEKYLQRIDSLTEEFWSIAKVDPKSIDRVILIGGSSRIPAMSRIVEKMVGKNRDGSSKIWGDVDVSLCVAEGAAIYAAYLEDQIKREEFLRANPKKEYKSDFELEIEIVTRTSHALGIEVPGGKFHTMIHRNSKTPCEIRQQFRPSKDYATSLDINIYQGNEEYVAQNQLIVRISEPIAPPRPKNAVVAYITISVDGKNTVRVITELDGRISEKHIEFT